MDTKALASLIVSLVVAISIFSSVLVPIVGNAQTTVGDKVTYTNLQNSTNLYRYDYVEFIEYSTEYSGGAWTNHTVNGQNIQPIADAMIAILSDGMSLQINTNGTPSLTIPSDPFVSSPTISSSEGTLNIVFKDGEWTITGGSSGAIASGSYTWAVTYVEDGKYIARNGNPTNYYNNGSPSDFILYGSTYTSGALDTYYAYGNGEIYLAVSGYSGNVNMSNQLVEGTTDVYQCQTCNITVTDAATDTSETFTPYRCLVRETIIGHEAGGPTYDLIGTIPLLVAVGIVIGVIGVAFTRRE